MTNDNIKVSICCITYNHEKYIEQALKSFLEQKVDFKYLYMMTVQATKQPIL